MDTSSFSDIQQTYPDAELLPVGGSTCDCYRVKLYGKFHFMKRLKPELRTDPRYVSALQKEFETGYRLDHPHLVRYVSKGEDYLLTEYVDGENLKEFSESHPDYFKSRKNADRILTQLLDVVGYLHQHQIVHLDLKPVNMAIYEEIFDTKWLKSRKRTIFAKNTAHDERRMQNYSYLCKQTKQENEYE